jgi:hypothetical protein
VGAHLKATELAKLNCRASEAVVLHRHPVYKGGQIVRLPEVSRLFFCFLFSVFFMYRLFSEQVGYLDFFKQKIVADELDPADNRFLGCQFPVALWLWVLICRWTKMILQY